MGHKNAVIYDGGFGHAVSAAPLEKFEAEISYMDSQLYLGDGAPVKTPDMEPGVSSRVCKCSLLVHKCWDHNAPHDSTGGGQPEAPHFTISLTLPCIPFP